MTAYAVATVCRKPADETDRDTIQLWHEVYEADSKAEAVGLATEDILEANVKTTWGIILMDVIEIEGS